MTALAGVGPRVAEHLARLGITTVRDVIYHLPIRYQDRTQLTPLARVKPKLEVVIEGRIVSNQLQYGLTINDSRTIQIIQQC